MQWNNFNSTVALNWHNDEASVEVPELWCMQLLTYLDRFTKVPESVRNLIADQHVSWQMPKLLGLPQEYEKIFSVRILTLILEKKNKRDLTIKTAIVENTYFINVRRTFRDETFASEMPFVCIISVLFF